MVLMATKTQRTERRTDALSKERIVEAAIEILDADGESALTFRALTVLLLVYRFNPIHQTVGRPSVP